MQVCIGWASLRMVELLWKGLCSVHYVNEGWAVDRGKAQRCYITKCQEWLMLYNRGEAGNVLTAGGCRHPF